MPRKAGTEAGTIRKRGQRYQVRVRAGIDPVTGKDLVLVGSASSLDEAKKLRRKFAVQLDDANQQRTKATFRAAMEKWLRVHEVDASTRKSYEMYARLYLTRSSATTRSAGSRPRCWRSSTPSSAAAVDVAATANLMSTTG